MSNDQRQQMPRDYSEGASACYVAAQSAINRTPLRNLSRTFAPSIFPVPAIIIVTKAENSITQSVFRIAHHHSRYESSIHEKHTQLLAYFQRYVNTFSAPFAPFIDTSQKPCRATPPLQPYAGESAACRRQRVKVEEPPPRSRGGV